MAVALGDIPVAEVDTPDWMDIHQAVDWDRAVEVH